MKFNSLPQRNTLGSIGSKDCPCRTQCVEINTKIHQGHFIHHFAGAVHEPSTASSFLMCRCLDSQQLFWHFRAGGGYLFSTISQSWWCRFCSMQSGFRVWTRGRAKKLVAAFVWTMNHPIRSHLFLMQWLMYDCMFMVLTDAQRVAA